jgi:hypothetical protein
MKLRLFIGMVVMAALLAPSASAALQLQTQSRKGMKATSRSANLSCSFGSNYLGLDDLLMRCRNSKGRAEARYDFYLPKNVYGTPAMHVFAQKLCCSGSSVKNTLVRLSTRHYRIVITVRLATRFDVRSVSLSYYVKT